MIVIVPEKVAKSLKKVPPQYQEKIKRVLATLQDQPTYGKKLFGKFQEQRSATVPPYRIIYEMNQEEGIILIVKIDHRQSAYKH